MALCRLAVAVAVVVLAVCRVTLSQAGAGGSSAMAVLASPPYLRFDAAAGPISAKDVPRAAAAALGLHSLCGWSGISVATAFSNPGAVILMAIDAMGLDLLSSQEPLATYPVTDAGTAAAGLGHVMDATHFGAAVLSASKQDATVHAACARSDLAAKAQPSQVSQSRALSWDADAKAMMNREGVRIGLSDLASLVDAGFFGAGAQLTSTAISVSLDSQSSYTFDLTQPVQMAFFAELAAISNVVATAAAQKKTTALPEAVSVAITTLRPLLAAGVSPDAAAVVVRSFLRRLVATAKAAFDGDVVILAVAVQADKYESAYEAPLLRRSVAGALGNGTPLTPNHPAWVQHCAIYNCYCHSDSRGRHWEAPDMCSPDCKAENASVSCSDCAYVPCGCNNTRVQPLSSKCAYCATGYKLYGNHCFVDSSFPVAFNIIFILGVFAIASLLAICYALGGMDPGRNSIIYRLTSQRPKMQ